MTRFGLTFGLVLIIGVSCFAEAPASGADSGLAGTKQFVFGFNYWNLASYKGGVGIRYFLRDDIAIRPSLAFGVNRSTDDAIYNADGVTERYRESDETLAGFSVVAEKYLGEFHGVLPFLGAGLGYTYVSGETDESEYYADIHRESNRCTNSTAHSMDVIGLVGFQWYFTAAVSLGGQYNLVLTRTWNDYDETRTTYQNGDTDIRTTDRKTRTAAVNVNAGQLLVSIRF